MLFHDIRSPTETPAMLALLIQSFQFLRQTTSHAFLSPGEWTVLIPMRRISEVHSNNASEELPIPRHRHQDTANTTYGELPFDAIFALILFVHSTDRSCANVNRAAAITRSSCSQGTRSCTTIFLSAARELPSLWEVREDDCLCSHVGFDGDIKTICWS